MHELSVGRGRSAEGRLQKVFPYNQHEMVQGKEGVAMSLQQRRLSGNFGTGENRNAGKVKNTILLFLSLLFLFLLFTLNAPQSTAEECDCHVCHGDHHGSGWTGCSGCHDSPPQTASHRKHYDSNPLLIEHYGDTSVASTAEVYQFGCGNCHPLDKTKHADGILQVELYNATAPAGSLKAKNPSSAAYTPGTNITTYPSKVGGGLTFSYSDGTCSNIYCHSGYTVTSSPVSMPLTYPENPIPPGYKLNTSSGINYIMDETCSNLTYSPYTVNYQRVYTTTPGWGTTGSFTTCSECHEFPLTTFYPSVDAAVGDSHQWVSSFGNVRLHAYNKGSVVGGGPLSCRTCHYSTVTQTGTVSTVYKNGAWIVQYGPVALSSRVMHVNGVSDVAFDTVNPIVYRYWDWGAGQYLDYQYSLASASYDPPTKTCTNVACHYYIPTDKAKWQQQVKWGGPFREDGEGVPGKRQMCDVCHRMGDLQQTCQ